jgi:hypothetical protein
VLTKEKAKSSNLAQFWCNVSPFRINTYKSVSKQRTLTIFRMNTYEKTGREGRGGEGRGEEGRG